MSTIRAYNDDEEFGFCYMKQPVKRWTFEQPKLKEWQEDHICFYTGKWMSQYDEKPDRNFMVLNAFAGKVRLDIAIKQVTIQRVDLSDEFNPDYNMDIYDFILTCKALGIKFDYIILDPPYNLRKAREKYGERYIGSYTKIKNELIHILYDNGIVVSYGYDTVGLSESRGFKKINLVVVCHSGDHNDTLVIAEQLVDRNKGLKYCASKDIYSE